MNYKLKKIMPNTRIRGVFWGLEEGKRKNKK